MLHQTRPTSQASEAFFSTLTDPSSAQSQSSMSLQRPRTPPDSGLMRNFIGSLVTSAFKLYDTTGKMGIWFLFHDLSIRIEGWFTLKFSFVNTNPDAADALTGVFPVLATVYSQPFQVFSAKKFPGMVESNSLSRCFAAQGMKIPIRKDDSTTCRPEQSDGNDA